MQRFSESRGFFRRLGVAAGSLQEGDPFAQSHQRRRCPGHRGVAERHQLPVDRERFLLA